MLISRVKLFNHDTSYTSRQTISEFFQLELNATYHAYTPVPEG